MNILNISITVLAIMIMLLSVFFLGREYTAMQRRKREILPASYEGEGYSPRKMTVAMMNLVRNGTIQKHVLFNTAPEHDDKAYFESFDKYLTRANVTAIKQIRGEVHDDWN
jgi:hypothetical protein